ncbi:hypothetical protein A3K86_16440 [Photobacterium jeanii]|uniref:Flavoprotein n=1 Tax=Photobacterium jeanii TaxID=858640 RepID=A0A178K936_9GAMM|nr:hypothetical protein [Photobacterium jeanii]OAN13244.1 hypothetical protein A3K86_16440 [Photobacterium jeanii]PST89395.1 hypothetical protein C9I91_14875 [Photobacterium jeanii]
MDAQDFNDNTIKALVEKVLAQMAKPTLLVLTAANGYRQEIASQLGTWQGIQWHILTLPDTPNEFAAVQHLGTQVQWDASKPVTWLDQYQQVLFPFLDVATLAEVSNGLHLTPAGQVFQYALMKGLPTYALNYQCDLTSELNQLLGLASNQTMCERATSQLATLTQLGAVTGSFAEIKAAMLGQAEAKQAEPAPLSSNTAVSEPLAPESSTSGYITLNEVMSKGVNAFTLRDNLTDLAAEYLKEQQQIQ